MQEGQGKRRERHQKCAEAAERLNERLEKKGYRRFEAVAIDTALVVRPKRETTTE
jgi:hypothetical protein